jgi:hypothetical protein
LWNSLVGRRALSEHLKAKLRGTVGIRTMILVVAIEVASTRPGRIGDEGKLICLHGRRYRPYLRLFAESDQRPVPYRSVGAVTGCARGLDLLDVSAVFRENGALQDLGPIVTLITKSISVRGLDSSVRRDVPGLENVLRAGAVDSLRARRIVASVAVGTVDLLARERLLDG